MTKANLCLAGLLLAACATKQAPPPPVVADMNAEPLTRVSPEGFEACLETAPGESYREEVALEFGVTFDGYVRDIEVLSSTNPCLNAAVTEAVSQWRYPPRTVDGVLAARSGVRTILVFNVEAASGEEEAGAETPR